MLENYNLCTNIISRQNVRSIIQGDLSKWGNQYDFIKNAVKSIREKLEMQHYLEVQHDVFQITESLRCDNEYVALKFYNTFFLELTTGFYSIQDRIKKDEVLKFTQSIDYTEMFYNLGKLNSGLGNTDTAIYYISLSDKLYSEKNSLVDGSFVRLLLNSDSHFLWSVAPNLICEYQNYYNSNQHASNFDECLKAFGIKSDRESFDDLFKSVDVQTLFQIVGTIKDISKLDFIVSMPMPETHYKSIHQFKSLGNLTWIFENYLKTNIFAVFNKDLHEKYLSDCLTYILKKLDKQCSQYFAERLDQLKVQYPSKFVLNTMGLKELIVEIKSLDPANEFILYAHFSLIAYLYRNYTSHCLDNTLKIGDSYYLKLSIFLSIITCFLIANKTFNYNKRVDVNNPPK